MFWATTTAVRRAKLDGTLAQDLIAQAAYALDLYVCP
jgi:hypothetical protein